MMPFFRMPKIKVLPDQLISQIAAGEVVERPASALKELLENSLDALSADIKVSLILGGVKQLKVTDNGTGIDQDDLALSLTRHATSKINTLEDLESVASLGFRGEALASIAAISHVVLKTSQEGDEVGSLLEIEGSQIKKNEPTVCAIGSSFEIKNLFYNVPARRNFLKSDAVEFRHILEEFERLALPHFDVELSLTHNGNTVFNLSKSNLRQRIVGLFGTSYNDRLVPINESTSIVSVEGFVGKPDSARKTRGEQFLFVNNRFFKDHYFNNAIQKAFENLILPKTFASYYLFWRWIRRRLM